jgi:glyoxylase I family protein
MPLPFRVAELDHLVLRCADQARMLDFYVRVLGLKEERRIEPLGLIQLRAGASMVDLVRKPEDSADKGANVDHFCLGIELDDLEKTIEYLRGEGVEVGPPAERYGARGMGVSIYIRDPEGNAIELKRIPSDISMK